MHTVTPHLICAGAAEAIEFYKVAFNAVEAGRLPGPNGKLMHAMIRIGDSPVMLVNEMPEWGALGPKALKGSSVTLHLYAEAVDAGAVDAGRKLRCRYKICFGVIAIVSLKTPLAIAGRSPRISVM